MITNHEPPCGIGKMHYLIILLSSLSSLFFLYSFIIESKALTLATFIGSLVVLITAIRKKIQKQRGSNSQSQNIGDNSFGIQANGDVSVEKKD